MTDHPSLPGRLAVSVGLADRVQSWPISASDSKYASPYINLSVDTIVDPQGEKHERAVVRPNGAVGVLAIDADDRLLLVEQYRHPAGRRMLEIPAGTLDVDGESPLKAAIRELAEEADVVAVDWEPMLDLFATPGYSTERWQVFRASGLSAVPLAERTRRVAEEADMAQWWLPFDQAVEAVLAGRFTDSMTVSAVLAAQVLRTR